MPLYEYRCAKCGAQVEKIQKFSDPPLRRCGKCGGKLERLLSSPAIQFKGSGWYVTDYARKPADSPGSKGDGAPSAPEKKPSAPAETPAPKASKTPKSD